MSVLQNLFKNFGTKLSVLKGTHIIGTSKATVSTYYIRVCMYINFELFFLLRLFSLFPSFCSFLLFA